MRFGKNSVQSNHTREFIKKPEKGNMITWQYIHLTNLTECIQCVTLWLQSTRDRAVSKTDKVPYLKE